MYVNGSKQDYVKVLEPHGIFIKNDNLIWFDIISQYIESSGILLQLFLFYLFSCVKCSSFEKGLNE